jgi:hypothetical protein
VSTRIGRRDFITMLGGAAVWPLLARGQEARNMVRIGAASIFPKAFPLWVAFRERLRELGYIEGRNIAFEFLRSPKRCVSSFGATSTSSSTPAKR